MAREGTDAANLATVIQVMEVSDALKNQRVCMTGHLGLPRHEIEKIITNAGGEVHKDIKWNTTILVTNQDWTKGSIKGSKSNKLREAEQRGTKIMSEAAFYQLIIDQGSTFSTELKASGTDPAESV